MRRTALTTLRILAGAGLAIGFAAWWLSQSHAISAVAPLGGTDLRAVTSSRGYRVSRQNSSIPRWGLPALEMYTLSKLEEFQAFRGSSESFEDEWIDGRPGSPGVATRDMSGVRVVWVDHWFVCGVLLAITAVTNLRPRQSGKPAPGSEADAA